jgi:hypothetical protein
MGSEIEVLPPDATTKAPAIGWLSGFTDFAGDFGHASSNFYKLEAEHDRRDRPYSPLDPKMLSSRDAAALLQSIEEDVEDLRRRMQLIIRDGDALASVAHINRRLALLAGSYPNGAPSDPNVYLAMMAGQIHDEVGPCILAVESACRKLARTSKFLPTIAEVMPVFKRHTERWWQRLRLLDVERIKQIGDELITARKQQEQQFNDVVLEALDYVGAADLAARLRADECFTSDEWTQIVDMMRTAGNLKREAKDRARRAKRLKREHLRYLKLVACKWYDDDAHMRALAAMGRPRP